MELFIIPKPVSINYTQGVFSSKETPSLIKKETKIFADGVLNTSCAQDGYKLVITKDNITAESPSPAGIHNAEQIYRQLLLSNFNDGCLTLPCAEIIDYPRFSWRGFMLDCSRYFYSVPFIKKILDLLSLHHINRFHWHLTDDQGWRLPVKDYPLLTEIGSRRLDNRFPFPTYTEGFYTEEEIKSVVEYAGERFIEVIPEVDLPGHASAILASYPGLGCSGGPYRVEDRFGIFEDVLCAGNEQIFNMIEKIFDTLSNLFPSKWVHIGGDEVLFNRWQDCPKCRKKLKELNLEKINELQSWITYKLVQMLNERGKTAIGWDEVLEDSPKFKLPKDTVIMSWRGSEAGVKAAKLGHKVIMSPNTEGCYFDYKHSAEPEEIGRTLGTASVFDTYSMNPAPQKISKEDASNILGGHCTLFSEVIYAGKIAEYMLFPRLCALAEAVWTPEKDKDFEDFSKRLTVHRKRLDSLDVNQYRGKLK